MTAKFSVALAEKGMSCDVTAAFYYHYYSFFVSKEDVDKAIKTRFNLP